MRFALVVRPKNYLLFTCHLSNTLFQFNLLVRRVGYEYDRYSKGLPIDGLSVEEIEAMNALESAQLSLEMDGGAKLASGPEEAQK